MSSPRERLATRLNEADLLEDRLIPVKDGSKASVVDHKDRENREGNFVELEQGNYGVYAGANPDGDRWLIDVDVDDYDEGAGDDGLEAVNDLPDTLTTKSPHTDGETGGHRYYYIDGEDVADRIEKVAGAKNPNPSFGEIRVHNQYVVGPGSQLDGCSKEWCDDCATDDGGNYELANDAPVAEITLEDLEGVLRADGYIDDSDDTDADSEPEESAKPNDIPDDELIKLAKSADDEGKFRRLWNGDTSDYPSHSEARMALLIKLAFWTGGDKRRMDRLFQESGLHPHPEHEGKWDRVGDDEITKAVNQVSEFYTPASDKDEDSDGPAFGLYDNYPALVAAKKQLESTLTAIENDDDGASEGQTKSVLTIAAKLPEPDYTEFRDRITDVTDLDGQQLDSHREYFRYREESGKIRVHDGQTWYLMEGDYGLYEVPVLNFEIDVQSILNIQGNQEVEAELRKRTGGTVKTQFPPKVLKRKQRFKDDVLGSAFGLNFDPPYRHAEKVLNCLNEYIGLLDVPERQGTHHIGLHGDEWVTPQGTLREDGWVDEPDTVFSKRDVALERVIDLPKPAEYDKKDVQTILRNVAETRDTERILPVLAWFYAVPFRPYIVEKWNASGLNHLNITGDTGSGKTTTLRYLWRMFGATPNADPFDVTDTNFAMIAQMATSNGFPVWYDEFKPSDIQDYKLDKFQDFYRKAATGGVVTRGKADQTTEEYHLRAPIVLSGEEQIRQPAERRRSIMVSFRESVTNKGTPTRRAFKELVGEGRIENGELVLPKDVPDPANHAGAYYRWVSGSDEDWLRAKWEDARELVWEIRQQWDDELDLGDMEIQSMQLVGFGWMVMREFAGSNGVAKDELPGTDALNDSLQHVVGEIGPEGQRKSHMDEFVELFARAQASGYVEPGVHYTVVHEGKPGEEELRIHVSQAYDALSKYVRDHDLTSVDLLSNAADYKKRFREAAESEGGYVATAGQWTPNVNGRCAGINTVVAMDELEFDRATFELLSLDDESEGEDEGNGFDAVPIAKAADRKGDYVTVTAEVLTVDSFGDGDGAEAVLQDSTGVMEIKTWKNEWVEELQAVEGKAVVIHDAKVRYDDYDDSVKLKPVDNLTEFEEVQHGVGYTEGDLPDGQAELDESSGVPDDATGPLANAKRLKSVLDERGPMDKQEVATALVAGGKMSGQEFDAALEKARHEQGWIEQDGDELRAL